MFVQLLKMLSSSFLADEEHSFSARLFHTVTLGSIVLSVVYLLVSIVIVRSIAYSISFAGAIILVCVISQILFRLGHWHTASLSFLIPIWLIVTTAIFFTGGVTAPGYSMYLTIICMAGLLLGIYGGIAFSVASILMGALMIWLQSHNQLPSPIIFHTPFSAWVSETMNIIMVFFIVFISVRSLRSALDRSQRELSARRSVEQERLKAETHYRSIIEQVPAVVYTAEFGSNGRWLYVSPQIEKLLGFKGEEWESDNSLWYKQLHPEDRQRVLGEEVHSRGTGKPLRSEYRLRTRDNKDLWFLDEAAVIRDSTGDPLFLQGVMYDISERKSVEERLAQSENKYRQLANLLPQSVFEMDLSGRITFANQTAFDTFGYDRDDLENGLNVLQMITLEDRQRGAENIQRILQGGKPSNPEYTAVAKDGRTFPVLIFSSPVYEEQKVAGLRGVIVDISGRKLTENKLRESEERFRSAFENAPIGMALVGFDDRILQVNQALCDILGYTGEQLLDKTVASITYPEDRGVEAESKKQLVENTKESFTFEKRYRHASGKVVWGQLSVSLVKDKDNRPLYYLGQLQDITARKEAEEILRASEQKYQVLYKDAERQAQELMLLHRVRNAMARELDLAAVIESVVQAVADTFGYTLVSLYLLQGDVLQLQSQIGYYEKIIRQIPIQNGICGRVARTKKPILIPDVHAEADFLGIIENITSEVCVPLFDRGDVAGVLNIESTQSVKLTVADLQLMTALSEHVSLAIERARLYAETRENEERFRKLIENSTDVISILESNGKIRYSSPSTQRVTGYSQNDYLVVNIFNLIHPDDVGWVKALFSEMIQSNGKSILAEFRLQHQNGSWRWMELTARNALNEPNILGIVANYRDITDSRTSADVIQTRAAYQTVLAKLGQQALIDDDLSTLMRHIVDIVAETLKVDFCKIMELMPDGKSLLLQAGVGWNEGLVGSLVVDADANSQAGFTICSRSPIIVEDLQTENRFEDPFLLLEHGVVSGMSVIIEGRDRPYGVLGVHSKLYLTFNQDDVYFLQSIANMLGAAIGRAQTDKALRSSEERYMLVATGANDGLWDWNLMTNEIFYSPRWKEMLGFSEGEILNKIEEWFQRIHPDDNQRVRVALSPQLNNLASRFELEYRIRHKDGHYLWVLSRGIILRDQERGAYRMAGSLTDITKRKEAEQQLQFDAFHDPLTGLSNRAYLLEQLAHLIKYSERKKDYRFAVLFLDLDEFKIVNDRFGHTVGDKLLKAVARRLEGALRAIDTFTRLGGDEFVILLEDINNLQEALLVAERVQEQLSEVFDLDEVKLSTAASIGIVWSEYHYERPDEILRDADIAMYRAKTSGKAHYHVFSPDMREATVRRMERELDLRHALELNQLRVFYQPIFSLRTNRPIGVEALVRWKHPSQGLVMPADFIKIAEDSNLIIPIDLFVLYQVCSLFCDWEEPFPELGTWSVHVNLSSKHFMQPNLADTIKNTILEARFNPSRVTLEITESVIMENVDLAMKTTRQLHDLGVQIALDDFGTGYSSLSYLTRFPVDILKLDQSFVPRIMTDNNTREIVDTVVKLARKLEMKVIAEGVETNEQLSELLALGCELGQGYLFSKPVDHESLKLLISQ